MQVKWQPTLIPIASSAACGLGADAWTVVLHAHNAAGTRFMLFSL